MQLLIPLHNQYLLLYTNACTLDSRSNTPLATFTLSIPATNVASFVFNPFCTLSFLGYYATPSSSVACALLSKNTGGTPCRTTFPKLKRPSSSLVLNFQLLTFNFKLPLVTPIIPPLTQPPSISPFPATLTNKTAEWMVYSVNHKYELRFTTHDSPLLRYCGDAHSLHLGELNTCGSC